MAHLFFVCSSLALPSFLPSVRSLAPGTLKVAEGGELCILMETMGRLLLRTAPKQWKMKRRRNQENASVAEIGLRSASQLIIYWVYNLCIFVGVFVSNPGSDSTWQWISPIRSPPAGGNYMHKAFYLSLINHLKNKRSILTRAKKKEKEKKYSPQRQMH